MDDRTRRVALVTGGTAGIGLASALALARDGARCVLTHRWGSADEQEIRARFASDGVPEPLIIEADVANDEDTDALLRTIHAQFGRLDIFISNVAFAQVVKSLADYRRRALHQSIDYTVWPLLGYSLRIREIFGVFPRHIVGLSSSGPDVFTAHYDFVAACKSMLETFARYMAWRIGDVSRVNVVRAGPVATASFDAVIGAGFREFARSLGIEGMQMHADEIGAVVGALCTGLLDGVNGQVITADRGMGLDSGLDMISHKGLPPNLP